jgi:Asp-tRNA(Asn)/Glu-tRNA(Gln) amidotransferase A subunit family amidase
VDGGVKAWGASSIVRVPATARERAEEATRGRFRGPLHGVPFAAKDIFYSRGLRTEAGSMVLAGFVPQYDATSIRASEVRGRHPARQAPHHGVRDLRSRPHAQSVECRPHAGWLQQRLGGRRGRAHGAVLASPQTAGSAVRPASYCGLVGLKPTFGRIPRAGVFPLAWTQDHVGLMARTVADVP